MAYTFPTTPYTFPTLPDDNGTAANDGFINVVDYGADRTGVADSTAAIQNAIVANKEPNHVVSKKILFFPNGTYKLGLGLNGNLRGIIERRYANAASANVIRWRGGLRLQGESEAGTILQVGNNLFTDPNNPRFVIYFASYHIPENNNTDTSLHVVQEAIGNEAYKNWAADLTLNLGIGNVGLAGINATMHNIGSIRRVTIDGRGTGSSSTHAFAGITNERQGTGPNHWSRITVKGCRYGVRMAETMYGQSIEHLRLENQSVAGINVNANMLAVRGLVSTNTFNSVPVVNLESNQINHFAGADAPYWNLPAGQTHAATWMYEGNSTGNLPAITLVDAELTGSGATSTVPAIRNTTPGGKMFLRNIQTTGFLRAAQETAGPVQNGAMNITEYATAPTQNQWSQTPTSLNLPILDTPERPYPTAAQMRSVQLATPGFPNGCVPGTDITAALQSAIDNCPANIDTLYFPSTASRWTLSGTVRIRGNVRHIMFNGADFTVSGATPTFRIEHTNAGPPVFLERWYIEGRGVYDSVTQIATQRDVVLLDGFPGGITNTAGTLGTLYIEDCLTSITLDFPQNVYARQFNADAGGGVRKYVGGNLWIFYYKSETGTTLMSGITGGNIEEFGSWHSPLASVPGTTSAYTFSNAQFSLNGVVFHESNWGGGVWNNIVNETQTAGPAPTNRIQTRTAMGNRGSGKHISLFRSRITTPTGPGLLSPVLENDSAQAITPVVVQPIAQVGETDIPLVVDVVVGLPAGDVQAVGQVTETEIAQTITPRTVANFSDLAQATTFVDAFTRLVLQAVEVDESITLGSYIAALIEEIDEALEVVARMRLAYSTAAVATTLDGAVLPEVTLDVAQVSETGTALSLVGFEATPVAQVFETDTALTIGTQVIGAETPVQGAVVVSETQRLPVRRPRSKSVRVATYDESVKR